MILLKTTTEIDENRVKIILDSGCDDVLCMASVQRDDSPFDDTRVGHVSRYQIALGMEW